jgi:hypothetical protein
MTRKPIGASLEAARQALAESEELIASLEAERLTVLLGDDNARLARIDSRLEGLRRQHRTDLDRVAVREQEAEKESRAKAASEKADLISRIERQFAERDLIAAEMAVAIATADRCFVRLIETARSIRDSWPWRQGDAGAAMLTESTVTGAIRAELYRVGGRPSPGGGQPNPHTAPSFPGGTPERLEMMMLPAQSARPLTEKFAEASVAAGIIMRTGRNDPAPAAVPIVLEPVSPDALLVPAPVTNGHAETAPVPTPEPAIERTPEQIELGRLLARQADLVSGPLTERDEAEYVKNGRRIAELSA